jgi:hypothetical protein
MAVRLFFFFPQPVKAGLVRLLEWEGFALCKSSSQPLAFSTAATFGSASSFWPKPKPLKAEPKAPLVFMCLVLLHAPPIFDFSSLKHLFKGN